MAKQHTGFEELFKKISLQEQLTQLRPAVLRDVFSETNRKRAAVALNNELRHFHDTFINTFIAAQSFSPDVQDTSPLTGAGTKSIGINWERLNRQWELKKKRKPMATPSFFSYGVVGDKKTNKQRKKDKKSPKPLQTLEQYLKNSWGPEKALNVVGHVTANDIIFKTAKGEDVKLKGGKAVADAAFLGKLKTSGNRDITSLTETFTIGFKAFPKLANIQDLNSGNDAYSVSLAKLFIPRSENIASKGFPLSKLINNQGAKNQKGHRPLRPTVDRLLNWYYRVKLPHVFREFYKTKGLVGR